MEKTKEYTSLELLQEFKKEILFTDLTFEFVSSFDNHLQSKGYLIPYQADGREVIKIGVEFSAEKRNIRCV